MAARCLSVLVLLAVSVTGLKQPTRPPVSRGDFLRIGGAVAVGLAAPQTAKAERSICLPWDRLAGTYGIGSFECGPEKRGIPAPPPAWQSEDAQKAALAQYKADVEANKKKGSFKGAEERKAEADAKKAAEAAPAK